MSPVELLADHQAKPRNIGKLMNANATGDVGSIVVGDALRFYIQVKDERITAAKFQVFNCQDQVAAASLVSELAVGRTLDEAWALNPGDLAAHAGGLDPALLPVRLWAIEGLRSAIAAYRGEERDADVELDPLLCRCHGIPVETVRQSIKVMALETVEDVVNATAAGSGCGSCRVDIPALLNETKNQPAVPETPKRGGVGGRIAVVHRINAVVDGELRPSLREAGVEVELLDLDGAQVVVRISGTDDETSRRNALGTLEKLLKQQVDIGLSVREG
jgi:NifU-like protein